MRAEIQLDGADVVFRIRVDQAPSDALIAIASEPLAALGLELKAVKKLVADGALKTVAIGRKTFTKMSFLVALVDVLPAAQQPKAEREDDLTIAARKRAMRRAS